MKTVIVQYKLHTDRIDENRAYVERVFDQLRKEKPDGIRYATFALDDGQRFVHFAFIDTPDGNNPIHNLSAFQEFIADIKDRCLEPPKVSEAKTVGSYLML